MPTSSRPTAGPPRRTPPGRRSPTSAPARCAPSLTSHIFRQVEYVGVIEGAANPEGAEQVVDFLLSAQFQQQLPGSMYVYPVDPQTPLPATWERFAPLAQDPYEVDPQDIDANRSRWVQEWTDTVVG